MLGRIGDELTAWVAANITLNPPPLPYISNVTGALADAELVLRPGLLGPAHVPARAVRRRASTPCSPSRRLALVEIGPGQSLGALVRGPPAARRSAGR